MDNLEIQQIPAIRLVEVVTPAVLLVLDHSKPTAQNALLQHTLIKRNHVNLVLKAVKNVFLQSFARNVQKTYSFIISNVLRAALLNTNPIPNSNSVKNVLKVAYHVQLTNVTFVSKDIL